MPVSEHALGCKSDKLFCSLDISPLLDHGIMYIKKHSYKE